MKQVPTDATLHSINSLSNADLSVFDSIDEAVLADYAVSFPNLFFTIYQC